MPLKSFMAMFLKANAYYQSFLDFWFSNFKINHYNTSRYSYQNRHYRNSIILGALVGIWNIRSCLLNQ